MYCPRQAGDTNFREIWFELQRAYFRSYGCIGMALKGFLV